MGAQPVDTQEMTPALLELHGPAYEWPLWSSSIRLVAQDQRALPSARRLVEHELGLVELAVGLGRRDSELRGLPTGRRVPASGTLVSILGTALRVGEETGGVVGPFARRLLEPVGVPPRLEVDEASGTVVVSRGATLDLDALVRAWTADHCAQLVAERLGIGVLVSLGGAVATAGPAGLGGWEVLVQDEPGGPSALVAIPSGLAIATATTSDAGMRVLTEPWRAATVVAPDAVTAGAWSRSALLSDIDGRNGLGARGLPARLVAHGGALAYLGDWPEEGELSTS